MDKIKKNFGFGCMRLPMVDGEVDYAEMNKMVDAFLEAGFNYFDTAHGYLDGKSETALRACLTSRYPRESYVLTNKLSGGHFSKQEDIRPLFESQLEACGVAYFDFYLMHAQGSRNFDKYKQCRAYETALELKAEGKIRHLGISFHDTAEVLDQILTEYPQVEVVQIQLNYIDFEDPKVQSRLCLEVCRKHGKPAIILEPVKGGKLVNLHEKAQNVLDNLGGGSNASYAIRFAAGQEGVMMVLSGMGNMDMMRDNLSYMQSFQPLTADDNAALEQVCEILRSVDLIPCTECRYCTEVCPQKIAIPTVLSCLNNKKLYVGWDAAHFYNTFYAVEGSNPGDCIECGACENACPQQLEIRKLLKDAAAVFAQ